MADAAVEVFECFSGGAAGVAAGWAKAGAAMEAKLSRAITQRFMARPRD